MKINWQIIILSILFILMAVVFALSYHFSYIQAKMAPMTISGLLVMLSGIQIIREIRSSPGRRKWSQRKPTPSRNSESFRPYLIQGSWMIGFVLAITFLGFFTAILLFGIAYMKTHGINWQKSIFISASTLIIIYVLFTKLLEVTLYPGLIPVLFFD